MKYVYIVVGILLSLIFLMASVVVLFNLVKVPPPPEGTPMASFMAAFGPTGYLTFIKVLELLGGILVAIPRTRRLGLVILGPIIVNILAFHLFLGGGPKDLADPMVIGIIVLPLILVFAERKAFAAFLFGKPTA